MTVSQRWIPRLLYRWRTQQSAKGSVTRGTLWAINSSNANGAFVPKTNEGAPAWALLLKKISFCQGFFITYQDGSVKEEAKSSFCFLKKKKLRHDVLCCSTSNKADEFSWSRKKEKEKKNKFKRLSTKTTIKTLKIALCIRIKRWKTGRNKTPIF